MAQNGINYTYGDDSRREDLLDVLTNIDPTEDRLFKLFGKETAYNTLHEWPYDSLETVGDNAQPEGGDAPADGSNDPNRGQNITQIFSKTAKVSGTQMGVDHAGFSNRMAYAIMNKMKALSNDIEFALVRGSIASGNASSAAASARRMRGIKNSITTNSQNYSGATLTEERFNDMVESAWDQGGTIDTVATSMKGKRRVSGFTAGSTKNIDADDKRLVNSVNVYESDASGKPLRIYAHRYVTQAGDYTGAATPGFDVELLQSDLWKVAILQGREPKATDLAKTGDYERKQIVTELTLEDRAEQGNAQGRVFF